MNGSTSGGGPSGGPSGGPLACSAADKSLAAHPWIWGTAAAFALLAGYAFATVGHRMFRATAVLTTFVAAFLASAPAFMLAFGAGAVGWWVSLAAGVGAVVSVVVVAYVRAALCAVGASAGAFAALRVWTVVPMDGAVGWTLVALSACCFGNLVCARATRPVLVLCTAVYGVLMCLAGAQLLLGVCRGQSVCAHPQGYAAAAAVLAALAALFQLTDGSEQTEADGAYAEAPDGEGEELLSFEGRRQ